MQLQNKNDNAANRKSYVGSIYNIGEKAVKESVLNSLDEKWAKLHREGYIHIHDLDAYGLTYNCLTFDILKAFPYSDFAGLSSVKAILGVFDFLKNYLNESAMSRAAAWLLPISITTSRVFLQL